MMWDIIGDAIAIGIIALFILSIYSGFRRQTIKQTIEDIKDYFGGGKDD